MSDAAAMSAMNDENVRLENTSGGMLPNVLIVAGAIGMVVAVGAGVGGVVEPRHARISLLVGIMATLAPCIGGLIFTMIFHLTNAGWCATIRRQFENVMVTMWVPGLLMVLFVGAEFTFSGQPASSWLLPENTDHGTEYLFVHKKAFLNPGFVLLRMVFYVLILGFLARMMWYYSTEQDRTGDKWLTRRARFMSAWGLPVAALTSTFFAFDWLMALTDYHFYSTMWGVYFFSGGAFSVMGTVILILAQLKRQGKLGDGVVTEEHLHDLSKLMFGFTVFWGYIAFGQYFLIWYSNIPEETAWFVFRKTEYPALTAFLAIGHFAIPFYILLWRKVRRNWTLISAMALWVLLMQVLDMYWILRPAVYTGPLLELHETPVGYVVDIVAIAGVVALFVGMLIKRIASGPLVPLHDPRQGEALHHRNYV